MIKNDRVYGVPLVQYKDTKANIEALSGIPEGAIAYATDSNEFGSYDGTTWTWGQSGSFDLAAAIHAATEETSLHADDEVGIWEHVSGLLRKVKFSTWITDLGAYFVSHSSSTAANDFLVGSGTGAWINKTLAQTITILRTSLDSVYAAISHTHAASDITSGTLGAARLPVPTTTTLGGVARNTGSAGEYVTGIDASGNLEYDTPAGGGSSDGWTAYSAVVPTRSAADDPTYTMQFAGVDLTGILCEGMPIKWTQNSIVRYGWISAAPTFSTNTTVKVLTRCNDASANYDVLDTATYTISDFAYGLPKQPGYGFPVSPEIWTLEYSNTSDAVQASPANGTWYNAGNQKLDVHIGSWRVMYQARLYAIKNGTQLGCMATLSTTNNGDSDTDFKTGVASVLTSFNQNYIFTMTAREKYLTLSAKKTYYLNIASSGASEASIGVNGATSKTIIRAISSYL